MKHVFTSEQRDFIRENVPGISNVELTDRFNTRFELSLHVNQIKAFKKNHKLSSGLTGRYEPGSVPFNKGKKKYWVGGEATQFQKGHKPHNYRPVGSERVNGDDYIDIKIADPNKWKAKHVLVWEGQNGAVPKGYVVIFGDGDRRNFDLNNLILVSRKQLAVMNKNGLIQNNAELTKAGIIIADIYQKIGKRKKVKGVLPNEGSHCRRKNK
ncbi:hypothetical protein D3C81_205750 [compost metagenome]